MNQTTNRSIFTLLALCAICVVFAPSADAQFSTTQNFAGTASTVVYDGTYVYVGRRDFPTVLVYDPVTSTQVIEISLRTVAQETAPIGVLSMVVAPDNSVIVGTRESGEMFKISNLAAASMGSPPNYAGGVPVSDVLSLAVGSDNRIYIGGRASPDTQVVLYRISGTAATAGSAQAIALDTRISAISELGAHDSFIFVGASDSPTGEGLSRAYLFDVGTSTFQEIFSGDTGITAFGPVGDTSPGDTPLFALYNTGNIRYALTDDTDVFVTWPDTPVNAIVRGKDAGDTETFVGSDSQVLYILEEDGTLTRLGIPDAAIERIIDLAFVPDPERMYGVATRIGGGSLLFYYDTVPPRLVTVTIVIDQDLRQPGSPDTFTGNLTHGDYTLRITTNEKLAAVPQITLTYSDGFQQNVPMNGSGRSFSGDFTIDSARAVGPVFLTFRGVDDAGNVEIDTRLAFILVRIGTSTVANNRIRINSGEFATLRYILFSPQNVSVKLYNMRGIEVVDLSPGFKAPGSYEDVVWRGRNLAGEKVASGVYLLRIVAGSEFSALHKIMVIR